MNSGENLLHFIRYLLSASVNCSLYSFNHPQVTHLSQLAFDAVDSALAEQGEASLVVIENEMVLNDHPQPPGLVLNRFAELLNENGIGHLHLSHGVSHKEITTLISVLSSRGTMINDLESCPHIRFGRVEVRLETDEPDAEPVELPEMQAEEMAQFLELYESAKQKKRLRISGMIRIVSRFIDAFRQESGTFLIMAALRSSDDYTFTHSTNVCILNLAQAMALGIEGQMLHDIGVSGMLHDVGKLFIPEEVLTKKGKLTPEEFSMVQEHPVLGARYLLNSPGAPHLAIMTAYEHHMKYNCTGYPTPPPGWQPNLCSQMTMLSDFFDALRTRRPYREPVEVQEIVNLIMDSASTDFNPLLVRNFMTILQRLDTGDNLNQD